MILRPGKILSLLCILLWGTGAAQLLHQRLEHWAHTQGPRQSTLQSPHPDQDHEDEADCPTCNMLAGMSGQRIDPAPLLDLVGQLVEVLPVPDQLASEITPLRTHSARGPPAVSPA